MKSDEYLEPVRISQDTYHLRLKLTLGNKRHPLGEVAASHEDVATTVISFTIVGEQK